MIPRRITGRAAVVVGAVLVLLGGGAAIAATASSPVSSGVIDGCYTNAEVNGSHVIVLQDAGTGCPKGTTAVSWNEQGAAGATGPQGPAGATGATGAQGPAGPAGPAGSVAIDSGVLQVSFEGGVYACSVSNVSGPDTNSITTTALNIGCEVTGLPSNYAYAITPEGTDSPTLGTSTDIVTECSSCGANQPITAEDFFVPLLVGYNVNGTFLDSNSYTEPDGTVLSLTNVNVFGNYYFIAYSV